MSEQNNCYQTFVIPIRITPEPTSLGIEDFPNLVDTFLKDKDGIVEYFEVYKVAVFYHNNLLSNNTYLILIRVFTFLRSLETIYQVDDKVLIKKGCNKGLTGTICKKITFNKYKVIVSDGSVRTYNEELLSSIRRFNCNIGEHYSYKGNNYPAYIVEDKDYIQTYKECCLFENTKETIERWRGSITTIPNQPVNYPRLIIGNRHFERIKLCYRYTNSRNKKTKAAICY